MSGTRDRGGAARDQRFDLRHAEVGVEPGRAAAAGSDADLDAVDAALDQEPRPFGGGHIAGDQLGVAELLAEGLDRATHDRRVSVGDIDDDDVRAGAQQLVGALEVVAFGADRGADPQAAVVVARGEGQPLLLEQVRGGDQSDQPAVAIDQRQLLDLVGAHDLFRAGDVGEPFANHEPFARCHPLGNRAGGLHEAQIARRQEAEQLPARVGDDQRAHAGAAHGVTRLGERRVRAESCTGRR